MPRRPHLLAGGRGLSGGGGARGGLRRMRVGPLRGVGAAVDARELRRERGVARSAEAARLRGLAAGRSRGLGRGVHRAVRGMEGGSLMRYR